MDPLLGSAAQGLRLGYLHSSPELLAPCSALAVDHPSVVLQYSLAELISNGTHLIASLFEACMNAIEAATKLALCPGGGWDTGTWERQVAVQRAEYQQRMETLCAGIEEHCKGCVRVIKPKGGFFLWIELLVRWSSLNTVDGAALV